MIKFDFSSGGITSNSGTLKQNGFNSHKIVPAGNTGYNISDIVDDLLEKDNIIKDLEDASIAIIADKVAQIKGDILEILGDDIATNTLATSTLASVVESYGAVTNALGSASMYSILAPAGDVITGLEFGSLSNSERQTGYFSVHADYFTVGRSLDANDPWVTNPDYPSFATMLKPGAVGTKREPLPAFAIESIDDGYNIVFNGLTKFTNLANGNGETIIDGGLITTDEIHVANALIIGSSAAAKHLGSFPQYFDSTGTQVDTIGEASYTFYTPDTVISDTIYWNTMLGVFNGYEYRAGDTYFDIAAGYNRVYDGAVWNSTAGEDGQSSSGYSLQLADANILISRDSSGSWTTGNASTKINMAYGTLDVTDNFDYSVSDNGNFKIVDTNRVEFKSTIADSVTKPLYTTTVIATSKAGAITIGSLSYVINSSNNIAAISGFTAVSSEITIWDTDTTTLLATTNTTPTLSAFTASIPISHNGSKEFLIKVVDKDNNIAYAKIAVVNDTVAYGGAEISTGTTLNYVKEAGGSIEVVLGDSASPANTLTITYDSTSADTGSIDLNTLSGYDSGTWVAPYSAGFMLEDAAGNTSTGADNITADTSTTETLTLPANTSEILTVERTFTVLGLEDGTGYQLILGKSQLKLLPNGDYDTTTGAYTVSYSAIKTTGSGASKMENTQYSVKATAVKADGTAVGSSITSDSGSITLTSGMVTDTDVERIKIDMFVAGLSTDLVIDSQSLLIVYDAGSPYTLQLTNDSSTIPANADGVVSSDWFDGDIATGIEVFLGNAPVTGVTMHVIKSTGGTGTVGTDTDTGADIVYLSGMTKDICNITIGISIDGIEIPDVSKVFTVTKNRSGTDTTDGYLWGISLDTQIISCDENYSLPSSTTVYWHVFKMNSEGTSISVGSELPSGWKVQEFNSVNTANKTASYSSFTVPAGTKSSASAFRVRLLDNNGRILDAESGSFVKDGADGDRGSVRSAITGDYGGYDGNNVMVGTTSSEGTTGKPSDSILNNAITSILPTGTVRDGDTVFWSNTNLRAPNPASGEAVFKNGDWSKNVALTVHGDAIVNGTLSADDIKTGTLDAASITVTNLNADNITSGSLSTSKAGMFSNHSGAYTDSTAITIGDYDAGTYHTIYSGWLAVGPDMVLNCTLAPVFKFSDGSVGDNTVYWGAYISNGDTITAATINNADTYAVRSSAGSSVVANGSTLFATWTNNNTTTQNVRIIVSMTSKGISEAANTNGGILDCRYMYTISR